MSFNVWYRLSEMIYQQVDNDDLELIFQPYVHRYIFVLYKHCQFDIDHEGIPDGDGDFAEFRRKTIETLKDVVFVVSTDKCVESMLDILKTPGIESHWNETEAALFIITAVVRNLLPSEDQMIPLLMRAIVSFPQNTHCALKYTTVRMLGQLNEWLESNPQYQEMTIKWLLECAKTDILTPISADSLEAVCARCKNQLTPHFDTVLDTFLVLDAKNSTPESAILALLRALAMILSELSNEQTNQNLAHLCSKQTDRLTIMLRQRRQLSNNNNENDELRLSVDPIICLDRLAAIFRHLAPENSQSQTAKNGHVQGSWLTVVQNLWPLLNETCGQFEANVRVIEHCCRTLRFVIRSLGMQSFSFIEPLIKQSFAVPSFALLSVPNGLRDHPDTVDDLFRLCIRFIQRSPSAFFVAEFSASLFNCALAALFLDHQDANRSVSRFFIEIIQTLIDSKIKCSNIGPAEELLASQGEQLVHCALQAALFHVHGSLIRDMAEILLIFGKLSKQKLSEWLTSSLGKLPKNSNLGATVEQLEKFHSCVICSTELRTVLTELRDLIELYR